MLKLVFRLALLAVFIVVAGAGAFMFWLNAEYETSSPCRAAVFRDIRASGGSLVNISDDIVDMRLAQTLEQGGHNLFTCSIALLSGDRILVSIWDTGPDDTLPPDDDGTDVDNTDPDAPPQA